MPTKNPRINVVLEEPLYAAIEQLAKRDKVSLSLKVRDLVKEALEAEEDVALSAFAEERDKTLHKATALKHNEVWWVCHLKLDTIETRLMTAPQQYGAPLRKTLKGYWKLRVGDYRIIFRIMDQVIYILGIIHRKKAYEKIGKRG
jgi:mRNA-degrading endonuclease RelE of RelBE toxin-antitoxin system